MSPPPKIRERPPGLIRHVLTVLVSGSGCCSSPAFRLRLGASDCSPKLAFCFMGPLDRGGTPPERIATNKQSQAKHYRGTKTHNAKKTEKRKNTEKNKTQLKDSQTHHKHAQIDTNHHNNNNNERRWRTEWVGARRSLLCQRFRPLFCTPLAYPPPPPKRGTHFWGIVFALFWPY